MFLPVGSNLPYFRFPVICFCWLALASLIFFGLSMHELEGLRTGELTSWQTTMTYAMAIVPAEDNPYWKFFSYQLFHASAMHLLSNMWYLIVFGWILENALGSAGFLLLSLLGGAFAVMPEFIFQADRSLPIVGASGSVAVMMGAAMAMFPRAKIRLLFLLIPLPNTPASFFVPLRYLIYFWLLMQASGLAMHVWLEPKPVAYATHLAGFGFGLLVGLGIYLYRFRKRNFFDVDLSGRELRDFYRSCESLKAQKFEEAGRLIRKISEANPWLVQLQFQLTELALKFEQKELAEQVWRTSLPAILAFKKAREADSILRTFLTEFGELPRLELQERVRLDEILSKARYPKLEGSRQA
ncbi:MAG: hypothetical protein COV44_04970 [Deltaproteobacteria bacterium CG11_big_fil_rev_8_21_14_0_20_45_16]|nr:MAG: hypothetical protein COV44_04970 [Deltaproteobacteria bacterium CG11_big_fil_rev_8_21_14_0_20_45_16]